MKSVTCSQMRELERLTIEQGVSGEVLMERAGRAVADAACEFIDESVLNNPSILIFAGHGNNGGDAFVAARYLHEKRYQVEVFLAAKAGSVQGDAKLHLEKMLALKIPLKEIPDEKGWADLSIQAEKNIIIDGLLGTGIKGAPTGVAAAAIKKIQELSRNNFVLSIDVPSGLNADSGMAEGVVVKADVTVTMGLPKIGLIKPSAIEYVGAVEVADIGIAQPLIDKIDSDLMLVTRRDLTEIISRRPRAAHKGTFGHVLVIGGAAGFCGAVAMCARAALRAGAGLVSVLVPARIATVVAGLVPEVMVHAGQDTAHGSLAPESIRNWSKSLDNFSCVLIGPGMTACEATSLVTDEVIRSVKSVLIMDADSINCMKGRAAEIKFAKCPVIITPHPGEMATLLDMTVQDVQQNRFATASIAAEKTGAIVVLKGAGTVISASGRPLWVNLNGNPGMATAGSGDVLGGIIAGLAAQKETGPFDSAYAGVYLHGRAGDKAARRYSQASMIATDIIDDIPAVIRDVSAR